MALYTSPRLANSQLGEINWGHVLARGLVRLVPFNLGTAYLQREHVRNTLLTFGGSAWTNCYSACGELGLSSSATSGARWVISAAGLLAINTAQSLMVRCQVNANISSTQTIFGPTNGSSAIQLGVRDSLFKVWAAGGGEIVSSGVTPVLRKVVTLIFTTDGTNHVFFVSDAAPVTSTTALQTGTPNIVYVSTYDSGSEPLQGGVYVAAIWNRRLTRGEVRQLLVDPYVMMQRTPARFYVEAVAGGATAFPHHYYAQQRAL